MFPAGCVLDLNGLEEIRLTHCPIFMSWVLKEASAGLKKVFSSDCIFKWRAELSAPSSGFENDFLG